MNKKVLEKAGLTKKARTNLPDIMVDIEQLLPLENKLAQIRKSILEDLPIEELSRLQVHAELLENALTDAHNFHHHDTNLHHDHDTLTLLPGLEPRAFQRRS